jgi:hypothetical protein
MSLGSYLKKRRIFDHAKISELIATINERFAVVTDGPLAGAIVDVKSGLGVTKTALNNMYASSEWFCGDKRIASVWLSRFDRREITSAEVYAVRGIAVRTHVTDLNGVTIRVEDL